MPRVMKCGRCKTSVRVADTYSKNTIKCPKADCGATIAVPAASGSSGPSEAMAVAQDDAPPAKVATAKEPAPALGPSEEPYVQVRLDENRVVNMSLSKIRKELLKGTLTRGHEVRWIELEPEEHDYTKHREASRLNKFRQAHKLWKQRRKWRPIGESLSREERSIEELYRLRVYFEEEPGLKGGFGVAMVVLLALIIASIWFVTANSSPSQSNEAGGFELLARGNLGGAWRSYQSTLMAFFILLIAFALWATVVGLLTLLAFKLSYHCSGWLWGWKTYFGRRGKWKRPPDDGYGT